MLQKWKKRFIRCLRVLLILFALFVVTRNWIARHAIQALATSFLDCPVQIEGVFIGFQVIQVDGIQVHLRQVCPTDSQATENLPLQIVEPNIRIACVRAVPSILEGIQQGIWVQQLSIDAPQLDLSFDAGGRLQTLIPTLPTSESTSDAPIPIGRVTVNRAQLRLQQANKSDLCLVADQIQATIAEDIDLTIQISDLLQGSLNIHTVVDQKTLAGRTQIAARNLVLDSQQLAGWPLVPSQVHQEPFHAVASWDAGCDHPANQWDPRCHDLNAVFTLERLRCSTVPELCQPDSKVTCSLSHQQGQVLLNLGANTLEGDCHLTARANLLASPLVLNSDLKWNQLQLEPLASFLTRKSGVAIPAYTAQLDGSANLIVTMTPGDCQWTTSTSLRASKLSLTGIPIGDVQCNVDTVGGCSLQGTLEPRGSVTASYRWDGIELETLSETLGLATAGRLISHGSLAFPFTPLPDWQALTAGMKVQWDEVKINGLAISDSHFSASASQGKATVNVPETVLLSPDGECLGNVGLNAQATLSDSHPIVLRFHASDFLLPAVARLAALDPQDLAGSVSISGVAVCPWTSAMDPNAWDSDITATTTLLKFRTESMEPARITTHLRKGVVTVPQFPLQWRNTTCQLAAHGKLQPLTMVGSLSIPDSPLTDLAAVARNFSDTELPLAGAAQVEGGIQVSLSPWQLTAGGQATVSNVTFRNQSLGTSQLDWTVDPQGLTVGCGSQNFFGGSYRIAGHLTDFDWTTTTIQAGVQDLQVARLLSMAGWSDAATGSVSAEMRATSIAEWNTLGITSKLTTKGVSLFRIPLHLTQATLTTEDGVATVTSRGQVSGGDFQLDAQTDLLDLQSHLAEPNSALQLLPVFFQARLSNLTLSSLAQNLRLPRQLAGLQGTLQGTCIRTPAVQQAGMLCTAEGAIEKIQWNRMQLSERITSDWEVRPDRIRLSNLSGRVVDGRLIGNAELSLEGRPHGSFQFQLNRVNIRRAAVLLGPAGKGVSGDASVAVNGRIGNTISGNMNVNVSHAVVSDLMVQQVSLPLDWSFSQAARSLKWRCRNGVVETGNGNIFLSTEGSFQRTLTAQLSARLERIDSGKLIRGKSFGAGIVNGTVSLKAQRALDPNQVNGNFDIQLSQIQAMEMPVLDQLPSVIQIPTISVSATPQENGGGFRGRVANGVVYLDDGYVSQSNVHVLVNGRATLAGHLNLDATASTQQTGPMDDLIALADSPLMLAGPAPVAMLAKANEAMKNRVVHVQLTGTAARPIIRLQPGKQLSQEALRFFIRSSLPTQFANVAEKSTQPQRR